METTETNTEKQPTENIDNRVQSEAGSIVDRADVIAKRIEEGNKKYEELIARQELAAARIMLGGRASAGAEIKTPEQIINEQAEEKSKAAMKRLGFRV